MSSPAGLPMHRKATQQSSVTDTIFTKNASSTASLQVYCPKNVKDGSPSFNFTVLWDRTDRLAASRQKSCQSVLRHQEHWIGAAAGQRFGPSGIEFMVDNISALVHTLLDSGTSEPCRLFRDSIVPDGWIGIKEGFVGLWCC